jgi:hypothetical protein
MKLLYYKSSLAVFLYSYHRFILSVITQSSGTFLILRATCRRFNMPLAHYKCSWLLHIAPLGSDTPRPGGKWGQTERTGYSLDTETADTQTQTRRGSRLKLTDWLTDCCKVTQFISYPSAFHTVQSSVTRARIPQRYSAGIRAAWSGGSIPGRGWEFLSSPLRPDWLWSPPTSYPMGTRAHSLGVKRPGHEADHSPSYSVEVKNVWSNTFTPQYAFMAWCPAQGNLGDRKFL